MLNWGVNPCGISLHILSIIYPLLFIILILVSLWLPYWHPNYIFVLEKSHIFKCLKAAKLHLRKHYCLGEETNTHKKYGTLPKIVCHPYRLHTQINKILRGRKLKEIINIATRVKVLSSELGTWTTADEENYFSIVGICVQLFPPHVDIYVLYLICSWCLLKQNMGRGDKIYRWG